jgi:hypothetical protein
MPQTRELEIVSSGDVSPSSLPVESRTPCPFSQVKKKREIEEELEKLNASLQEYLRRNTSWPIWKHSRETR